MLKHIQLNAVTKNLPPFLITEPSETYA